MYPPFWFSMLESKKAMLILLKGNFKISISEGLIVSSKPSCTISTLDSTNCNMEGHVKLIDRLSSPSDRLIHQISHPSEEQTLAKLNLSCSFASECTASQFATLTSVKGTLTVSKVL